jgi:hypothetical protein
MNILDRLANLRTSTQGCVLVALADLSSGIVPCSSTALKQPQERLDAIASNAVNLLAGKTARNAASILGIEDKNNICKVIALNPSHVQMFIRSRKELSDALCCICSTDVDSKAFMIRARRVLDDIATTP